MTASNFIPVTPEQIAQKSQSETTTRIQQRPRAWGREQTNTKICTTFSRSFAIHEPRPQIDAFIRWVARPDATATFLVSRMEIYAKVLVFSHDAKQVFANPNAGGSSALSEALSCEVLSTQFGVSLCRTEMQIKYWAQSKITDFSVTVGGVRIGVSVTRACAFRGQFTLENAQALLTKKLNGINDSTEHVITPHAWRRQALHIFVQHQYIADLLEVAYNALPTELRRDTLVLCTITQDADWIYFGGDDTPMIQ